MNETAPRTQMKAGMMYGFVFGVALVGISLLFYVLDTDLNSKMPQLAGYGALLVSLFIGIKTYRDQDLGGYISYGKSLGTGVLIAFFGSVIAAFYTYVFFTFIDPAMIDKIMEMSQQKMMEKGLPDEQVESSLAMVRQFMTPGWMFCFAILTYTFMGFLFSLIISIFTKREQQNPFNSNLQ
jgi:Protein of unknown function (DUF4199)